MVRGIVRRIDELGRIALPIEIRRRLELNAGDRVGMRLFGKTIRINKNINGMDRPIDELGRIVVPIELRRTLGLTDRQPVDMWVEDGDICVVKDGEFCAICGRTGELFELYLVKEVHICKNCALAVTDMVMEKGL